MSHERPHGWSLYPKATGLPVSAFQFRINGEQKGHHHDDSLMKARKLSGEAQVVQQSCYKAVCPLVNLHRANKECLGTAALPPSIQSRVR